MRRAIQLARQGENAGSGGPIGCVIVRDGQVVAEGHNEVFACKDPTAHAEMVTIRRATSKLQDSELRGAVLYSTLQPCGMCTMASIWAKIGRIVYGAGRDDVHSMYFEGRHLDTFDFIQDAFREDLELVGNVLRGECASLYVGPDQAVPSEGLVNM